MRLNEIPHPPPNDIVVLEYSAADICAVPLGERLGQDRILAMDYDSVALWGYG
jgi:hypothetical protein